MSAVTTRRVHPDLAGRIVPRPIYELRGMGVPGDEMELEIWELPSPSTPRLKQPERTATLKGRPLRLVENLILRRLKGSGIRLSTVGRGQTKSWRLDEDLALHMALLFRVLAPMKSIERISMVAEGIERLSREEAGYWLGMAVHRVYPRRVLAALRILLTTP